MSGHTNTRMTQHYAKIVISNVERDMEKLGERLQPSSLRTKNPAKRRALDINIYFLFFFNVNTKGHIGSQGLNEFLHHLFCRIPVPVFDVHNTIGRNAR